MKANIKLSLFQLTFVKLLALLRNVVAKMTDNDNFTTPAVPLPEMTDLADALEVAIEDATNGSRQSKLVRNALVDQARVMLNMQANYVRSVCAGDVVKLESSGFELAKQPEPIGLPGMPKQMQALFTYRRGAVDLRWSSVRGAQGYQVRMADSDPAVGANWQTLAYTAKVRHTVTGLETGKTYWFCVSAIGAAGEGAQSDPAKGIAA